MDTCEHCGFRGSVCFSAQIACWVESILQTRLALGGEFQRVTGYVASRFSPCEYHITRVTGCYGKPARSGLIWTTILCDVLIVRANAVCS